MEVFKRLKDFPGYAISKLGNVKNIKLNKLLKKTGTANGNYVYMWNDKKQHGRSLARLLAITFIPNPNNYNYVDYIDGNFENDNLSNLEWVEDWRKQKKIRGEYKKYERRRVQDNEWLKGILEKERINDIKIGFKRKRL